MQHIFYVIIDTAYVSDGELCWGTGTHFIVLCDHDDEERIRQQFEEHLPQREDPELAQAIAYSSRVHADELLNGGYSIKIMNVREFNHHQDMFKIPMEYVRVNSPTGMAIGELEFSE